MLLRVDFEGGSGFGASRIQREQALADQLGFLLWQLGDKEFTIAPVRVKEKLFAFSWALYSHIGQSLLNEIGRGTTFKIYFPRVEGSHVA